MGDKSGTGKGGERIILLSFSLSRCFRRSNFQHCLVAFLVHLEGGDAPIGDGDVGSSDKNGGSDARKVGVTFEKGGLQHCRLESGKQWLLSICSPVPAG
jgi:hypothetical protein